jgi:hypothetical protein
MWLITPTLWLIAVYVLFSILIVILLRQLKSTSLKASLLTLYFCGTIFAYLLVNVGYYAFLCGRVSEDLRRSSVATAEDVRTLLLLQKSNAREANSNLYWWVTHNLENEIDGLLPVANDYLSNSNSLCWRLQDWWFHVDVREVCFERDLPLVVRYRESHPPVWNHGPYDLIMKRYKEPTKLWKGQMWPFDDNTHQTNRLSSDSGKPNN